MSDETLIALIGAGISILIALFSARASAKQSVQNIREELKKEFESRFNERQWEAYTDFSHWMIKFLDGVKSGNTNVDKMGVELRNLVLRSWMFGSKDLISAFNEFYNYSRSGPENVKKKPLIRKLFQIVVEMRIDLGDERGLISADDLARTIYPEWDSLNDGS